MTTLWMLIALWIGAMMGFFLFALMAMARNGETHESRAFRHAASHARLRRDPAVPTASAHG